MRFLQPFNRVSPALAAGALVVALALPAGALQAQAYSMRISTPTIHDIPNAWIAGYAAALEKDSGGRIKVQVFPASQLGSIPRQIEGTQFGSIQCEVVPPEFMVGLDPRFQVLAAPGLVDSESQGHRLATDPAVRKLIMGLGADKGLHGIGLFFAQPDMLITRTPLRNLADFKGKRVRIFASPFQTVAFERLGMTPVAMTLGDVVPGLQEGTIDGAILGIGPAVNFHMVDAAKYITEIDQPGIFLVAELNNKWYESLPKDLQQIVERDAAKEDKAIAPIAAKLTSEGMRAWTSGGGTLIKMSPEDKSKMMSIFAGVGTDVSKSNPKLAAAYKTVTEAAKRVAETAN